MSAIEKDIERFNHASLKESQTRSIRRNYGTRQGMDTLAFRNRYQDEYRRIEKIISDLEYKDYTEEQISELQLHLESLHILSAFTERRVGLSIDGAVGDAKRSGVIAGFIGGAFASLITAGLIALITL